MYRVRSSIYAAAIGFSNFVCAASAQPLIDPIISAQEEERINDQYQVESRWDIKPEHFPRGVGAAEIDRCMGYYLSLKSWLESERIPAEVSEVDRPISVLSAHVEDMEEVGQWEKRYSEIRSYQIGFPEGHEFTPAEISIIDPIFADGMFCMPVVRCVEKDCESLR